MLEGIEFVQTTVLVLDFGEAQPILEAERDLWSHIFSKGNNEEIY